MMKGQWQTLNVNMILLTRKLHSAPLTFHMLKNKNTTVFKKELLYSE